MDTCKTISNECMEITFGEEGVLAAIHLKDSLAEFQLSAPIYEVNKHVLASAGWRFFSLSDAEILANDAREYTCQFENIETKNRLILSTTIRIFPGSPFFRFRYTLSADEPVTLTKADGGDNITYTGIHFSDMTALTELQLSQFDPLTHCFIPCFQQKSNAETSEGTTFPGPVAFLQTKDYSALLAYEHGAEYPDSYLHFTAKQSQNTLALTLQAKKGNYYAGQSVDSTHPLCSPWFHFAAVQGDLAVLFDAYRRFFLKDICVNNESRKPYIFYNTWNKQERSRYYHNLPYLHTMYLEHTLQEIDIAAKMGIDVFVIDTGWYNKTGDWVVNFERFPDGLKTVKAKLDSYGMKLGLWFNPIVAATTSDIMLTHSEFRMNLDGVDNFCGPVWETEESWGMCLASGYTDFFIQKLIALHRSLGVSYFKWDAIGQYGCNSPNHYHGTDENTPQERQDCYSYQMGLEMIRIVEAVQKQCPDIIVDFDVTEGGRFVGLGFLSVGKYFLINNGPYYANFDIPKEIKHIPDTINVFFYPGAARARICRQAVHYDSFIPSILFLTHFLPDKPQYSQRNTLASLMLGGNGIWGDLAAMDSDDIALFAETIKEYKLVATHATAVPVKATGFIGSSPEIYQKLDVNACKGFVCFFTHGAGTYQTITEKINTDNLHTVIGADSYEVSEQGRLIITVTLAQDDSRIVFIR